jgi:hypothetical protein
LFKFVTTTFSLIGYAEEIGAIIKDLSGCKSSMAFQFPFVSCGDEDALHSTKISFDEVSITKSISFPEEVR